MVSPVRSKFRFTVWNVGRESHEAGRPWWVLGVENGGGELGEPSAVQRVVFVVTGGAGSGGGAGGAGCVQTLAACKYNARLEILSEGGQK